MTPKHRQRARLFKEQRGLCYYCAAPMLLAPGRAKGQQPLRLATLDHVIPRSLGGANAPTTNTVAACHACNNERGNRDARIFLLEKMGVLA